MNWSTTSASDLKVFQTILEQERQSWVDSGNWFGVPIDSPNRIRWNKSIETIDYKIARIKEELNERLSNLL